MTKTKQIICHCVSPVKACRYDRIYDFFIVIVKIHKHHWEFLITIQHLQIFLSGSAYNDNTIYSFFLQKLRRLQSLLCMRVNDFKHCKAVLLYRSRCKLLIHFPVKWCKFSKITLQTDNSYCIGVILILLVRMNWHISHLICQIFDFFT